MSLLPPTLDPIVDADGQLSAAWKRWTAALYTQVQGLAGLGSVAALDSAVGFNTAAYGVPESPTDATTALNALEALAFAAGKPIIFAAGRAYEFTGSFQPRISVYGWGATLKQRSTVVQATDTPGTLHLNARTDVYVYGLIVDGSSKWPGLTADGCTRPLFFGTTAQNCITFGHAVLNSTEVTFLHAKSRTVAYRQPGVAGLAADGFYHSKCTDVKYADCNASNFRRIGFVSEGDAGTKSDFVKYTNCDASNANNCDDSTTEYNAGFWHENTHTVDYVGCTARNMAGNAGQASGRVRGFVASIGETHSCAQSYVNCGVEGGSGNVPIGFYAEGTAQRPIVNYVNCSVRGCASGLACGGGLDTLRIKNFNVDNINAGNSNGGILFDIAAAQVNVIDIDGVKITNGTFTTDSAWINFFSGNASTVYMLRGLNDGTHVMHGRVARAIVSASTVQYGAATYSSFLGDEIRFGDGFRGSLRAGAVTKLLFDSANMGSGSSVWFAPSAQFVESAFVQWALGGTCNIYASGAKFDKVGMSIQMSGSFVTQFTGCNVENADATHGFIESSAVGFTRWELLATGNRFTGGIPLVKSTGNPTFSVLRSNTHVDATLHTFTAGVTASDNLNTP